MEQRYLNVTALNRYLKAKMDSDPHLNRVFIQGELSNVKYHYSGHCYFTLKDEKSRINAVMFAAQLKKVPFLLEDGMKVLTVARVSVYEPQGTYQLYVDKLELDGLGNLFMAYENLRMKLEQEGLFKNEHKQTIPSYPERIGIITAPTGAAIHDITKTIHQNCPCAKMFFYPSLVQGEQAADNLCHCLKQADKDGLDVIIIGRGGGSLEDLWAFNDERLARIIYQAKTPIISGVGHESDVTICDFVSDQRAATPTAAAHLATFKQTEFEEKLRNYQKKMEHLLLAQLESKKKELSHYQALPFFKKPQILYENAIMRLDDLSLKLVDRMKKNLVQENHHIETLSLHFYNQMKMDLLEQKKQLNHYDRSIHQQMHHLLDKNKQQFAYYLSQLNALSPLSTLERGYTFVLQNNSVVTCLKQVDKNSPMTIRFKDGDLDVTAKENENEENEL